MIKTTTLVSLLVLMLNQAHAAVTLATALTSWDECLFKRTLPPAQPSIAGNAVHTNHLQANANNETCVKAMHVDFLNHLHDTDKDTVLDNLIESNTISSIPLNVVKNFKPALCTVFKTKARASLMTIDQIKELPNACIDDDARIKELTKAQAQAIVPKQNESGHNAKTFLGFEGFRKHMTDTQLKATAGSEFADCKELNFQQLLQINPVTLAKLDARCFKSIKWTAAGGGGGDVPPTDVEAKQIARLVKAAAFKELPGGLPSNVLNYLKPAQIKELDSNNKDEPCSKLKLDALPVYYSKDLPKKCFKNAATGSATTFKNMRAAFFAGASKDLFSDFKESDDFAKLKEVPLIWHYLAKEHYESLLKHDSEICTWITFSEDVPFFTYASDLDAACFAKMTEDAQKWVLRRHTRAVKEDILSKLDSTHGGHLEEAIKVIARTRPSLLRHFGAGEVGGENVCSAYKVTQLKDPKDLKKAGRYFPDNCIKTMINEAGDEDVQYTELSKYPKNVVALLDMDKLLANMTSGSLSDMDEAKWKAFINPNICKVLKYEQFEHVPRDVSYKFITVGCLDELTFLDTLASNDSSSVKNIPPAVIGAARPSTIGALANALSDEQIKLLGVNASGLGDDAFGRLEADQIGALSAQAVSALPVGAFKALKEKEKWTAIKPASLQLIRYEQLDAVPVDILLHTTEKQAAEIPVGAVKAFEKCHDKLPSGVQGALKQPPKEEPKK